MFLIELALEGDYYWLGIKPRHLTGITGIFTSPVKHGDLIHLLGNLMLVTPLLIGSFLILGKKTFNAIISISILANLLVWIFGRASWHYGASGVVYGLFFFMIVLSFRFRMKEMFVYPLIVLFLSAGFWVGLLPVQPGVSFEGHLFGSMAGAFIAFFIKNPKKNTIISDDSTNSTIKITYNYIYKEKTKE